MYFCGYVLLWLLEIKCPYSIDGTVTVTLTSNEIADKFVKKFCLLLK